MSHGTGDTPPSLSVDMFRRSRTDLTSPTRTLRLSEQELSSREPTPLRVTVEVLRRPRSNQRTRTPARYESPLDPDAFRRDTIRREEEERSDARRITIRPLAGATIGTHAPIRERARTPVKSRKQGPSHRKIRRWNNEHFNSLAAEIAALGKGGVAASAALSNAAREAHLHKAVYDPNDLRCKSYERFMNDDSLRDLREKFLECEIAAPAPKLQKSNRKVLTAEDMMRRIDNRLRRVVVKACQNSYPAVKVVTAFEEFIIATFTKDDFQDDPLWWSSLLIENPTVTEGGNDDKLEVLFAFPGASPTGGFHRLLLHAVAQFHGLSPLSKTKHTDDGSVSRNLTVTGRLLSQPKFLLTGCLANEDAVID